MQDSYPFSGEILAPDYTDEGKRVHNAGSIICVVATDAPLLSSQITRLCKRAALGIGRVGLWLPSDAARSAVLLHKLHAESALGREKSTRCREVTPLRLRLAGTVLAASEIHMVPIAEPAIRTILLECAMIDVDLADTSLDLVSSLASRRANGARGKQAK